MTFKENAMFLLDLASTCSSGSRSANDEAQHSKSGPWAVSEFKCLENLEASANKLLQPDTNEAILQQLRDRSSKVRTLTGFNTKI